MFTIQNAQIENLRDIAGCHISCFPKSLATRLGKSYVQKTLEWFLVNPNRFLFHVVEGGVVAGYCGGFIPQKPGDGSSSGMLQYAFKQAIRGILRNPLLLFHPEVTANYPFLWMNIKRKITGKTKPFKPVSDARPFRKYVGLVVIGVHPDFRGKGVAQQLMAEFENRTRVFDQNEMVLSVKKDNGRAIKAYSKFGWTTREENGNTFIMHKFI
ncbi:MAG: family N-acetyltransferase [Segetibacter sp.]|jgi:ribosomal protein S18 acetylase RimI-like enzyme|nr:family N-acetyltransferase [Segetibacter sp.]